VEPPALATIVAVRGDPETGTIEVHLRRGERRTIGRAPMADGLAGAAASVLDALRQHDVALDLEHEGRIAWVRTVKTTLHGRFVVAVGLGPGGEGSRQGIGTGSDPVEAATRATLDALRPDRAPGAPIDAPTDDPAVTAVDWERPIGG
jgi:hypothetical protein